jgi:hypothetical protein
MIKTAIYRNFPLELVADDLRVRVRVHVQCAVCSHCAACMLRYHC